MYRGDAFRESGGFDPRSGFALDVDLAMRIAARHDFYYIDRVLSSFRYTPISLTAAMHSGGSDVGVFYYITRKTLGDPAAMKLFPATEHRKLTRDSLFFCSCRALSLNAMAGMRARNGKIILQTLRLIFREGPLLVEQDSPALVHRARSLPFVRAASQTPPAQMNPHSHGLGPHFGTGPRRHAGRRPECVCVFSFGFQHITGRSARKTPVIIQAHPHPLAGLDGVFQAIDANGRFAAGQANPARLFPEHVDLLPRHRSASALVIPVNLSFILFRLQVAFMFF